MTYTIAFAGAHSTGKTSTLNTIKASKWPDIYVDSFRASRHAQEQMGLELSEIVGDKKLYQTFQDMILTCKWVHEDELRASGYKYVLVDRSPADIYAYAYMWHKRDTSTTPADDAWFSFYEDRLATSMGNYNRIINFPIVPEVPFVPEPGRATADTRDEHSRLVNGYLALNARHKTHHLQAISLGARVNEILDVIEAIHD